MKVRRTDLFNAFQFGVHAIPLGWSRRTTFTPNKAEDTYELCRGERFIELHAKDVRNGDWVVYDDDRWATYSVSEFRARFEIVEVEGRDA